MSEREPGPYDSVARKWLALVERRRENFIDLCNSGRWRQYYTRAEIIEEMRKVLRLRDQWAINAGLPPSGEDESSPQWALSLDKIYDESQPREPSAGVLARRVWARLGQTKLDWARLNQPGLGRAGLGHARLGDARLGQTGLGETGQTASGTLSTALTRGSAERALSAAFPGFFHPAETM